VLKFVEKCKHCEKCAKPTLFLEYDGLVISGCDDHMVELGELLRETGYYDKYLNIDTIPESDN